MSIALQQLQKHRATFYQKSDIKKVDTLMRKITSLVNNLALGNLHDAPPGTQGGGFNTLQGSELSEFQIKISGYKFYLADMIADLMAHSYYLEAYVKDYKAQNWNRVKDEIVAREGKVKNKEMIDNELMVELSADIREQIFYESEYQRIKLKSMAIDHILTCIIQRVSELKRQIDMAKNI